MLQFLGGRLQRDASIYVPGVHPLVQKLHDFIYADAVVTCDENDDGKPAVSRSNCALTRSTRSRSCWRTYCRLEILWSARPRALRSVCNPTSGPRCCNFADCTTAATMRPRMLNFTRYQWTVLTAAWLGWGFDVFDGLLFNYVAPNAVPTLLGLPLGSPEARGGHAVLDRPAHFAVPDRLGRRRRDLRTDQ